MQKLIYVPPGADIEDTQKCIKLTAEYPFLLSSVSGLGGVENDIISSEVVGMNGELLTIYTERGKKKVRLTSGNTETDAFRYLSPVSRFWELKPGINHIRYGSGGTAHTSIHIRYKERYSGV